MCEDSFGTELRVSLTVGRCAFDPEFIEFWTQTGYRRLFPEKDMFQHRRHDVRISVCYPSQCNLKAALWVLDPGCGASRIHPEESTQLNRRGDIIF